MLDARLSDGSRVAICVPPASGAPAVTIRRFSKVVLTAADLVRSGSLPQTVLDLLGAALRLAVDALLVGDVARVLAVLQEGIGTAEHVEFVKQLRTGS